MDSMCLWIENWPNIAPAWPPNPPKIGPQEGAPRSSLFVLFDSWGPLGAKTGLIGMQFFLPFYIAFDNQM